MKIALIAGTRPEVIKMAPLYMELRKYSELEVIFISTGQHTELTNTALKDFGITPDFSLNVMVENQSLNTLSKNLLEKIDDVFQRIKPSMSIVQGDTTTAVIGGLASFNCGVAVAHLEAGLRSESRYEPFPEEINRRILSQIAEFHVAPTQQAQSNLIKEGITPSRIKVLGNTGIDALHLIQDRIDSGKIQISTVITKVSEKPIVLVTTHRRENFGEPLIEICQAIKNASFTYPEYTFVLPVHPNPHVKNVLHEQLKNIENIKLFGPLSYAETILLIMKSKFVITDSGGIQEEATSLNRKVIVLRNTTERQEAVLAEMSFVTGTNYSRILEQIKVLMAEPKRAVVRNNIFGNGKTSIEIARFIKEEIFQKNG